MIFTVLVQKLPNSYLCWKVSLCRFGKTAPNSSKLSQFDFNETLKASNYRSRDTPHNHILNQKKRRLKSEKDLHRLGYWHFELFIVQTWRYRLVSFSQIKFLKRGQSAYRIIRFTDLTAGVGVLTQQGWTQLQSIYSTMVK